MAEIGKNNQTNFEHFEAKTQKTAQRTWLKFIKKIRTYLENFEAKEQTTAETTRLKFLKK